MAASNHTPILTAVLACLVQMDSSGHPHICINVLAPKARTGHTPTLSCHCACLRYTAMRVRRSHNMCMGCTQHISTSMGCIGNSKVQMGCTQHLSQPMGSTAHSSLHMGCTQHLSKAMGPTQHIAMYMGCTRPPITGVLSPTLSWPPTCPDMLISNRLVFGMVSHTNEKQTVYCFRIVMRHCREIFEIHKFSLSLFIYVDR